MSNLIINLRGGTGNQLFQAAAALSLASTYKKNCQFCINNIGKDNKVFILEKIKTVFEDLSLISLSQSIIPNTLF